MSVRRIAVIAGLALIYFQPQAARALSVSLADVYFPSYGQARHMDQSNEYLGQRGNVYDGVTYGTWVQGLLTPIHISPTVGQIFGTGDYEYLSLWIDWNRNRTWDASEEVVDIDDQWFDPGTHRLDFDIEVPQNAALGDTWMRARFAFDGDLPPAGDLLTGEVEDYQIHINSPTVVPEPGTLALLTRGWIGSARRVRRRRATRK